MAYKISGTTSASGIVHILKDNTYLGYKNIDAGAYNAVVDTANGTGITAVAEDANGYVTGYGGIVGISTGDAVNITELAGGAELTRIQFTYTSIDVSQTTGTSNFSAAIDLDNTIPVWAGCATNYADPQTLAYIEPISTTQVRATRDGSPSAFTTANCYWMEFEAGAIKSVDYGVFQIGSGNLYQIINVPQFNPNKAMLCYLGSTVSNVTTEQNFATRMNFDSTTSIICWRSGSAYTSWTSYALVEFN